LNFGRWIFTAIAVASSAVYAFGQVANPTTVPDALAPGLPPMPVSTSDAAEVVSTTESLPPPAALPEASINAMTKGRTVSVAANLARPDFVKAIWVDAQGPALRSPEAIKKLVEDCRASGFNTIYAQVRALGDALYSTTLVPRATRLPENFDPLKILLEEAHKGDKPLKVHALLVALRVWGGETEPQKGHVVADHPEWVILGEDGTKKMSLDELWLDPGIIAVQDHMALIVTDLAKNYEVDGVQIDRIRYPELDPKRYPDRLLRTGYSPAALERFNQEKGATGRPNPKDPVWTAWRREQVTLTLKKMRDAIKAVKPSIEFSAGAVTFGTPPATIQGFQDTSDPYASVLEDWAGWCEKGLLDVNVLMDYKSAELRPAEFRGWMDFALANKGKAKVVIGVGGFMNQPEYTAGLMLDPILDPRADGVALYGYNDLFRERDNDGKIDLIAPIFNSSNLLAKQAELASAADKYLKPGDNDVLRTRYEAFARALGMTITPPQAEKTPVIASKTPSAAGSMPSLSAAMGVEKTGSASLPSLTAAVPPASVAASLPPLPSNIGSAPAASLPPLSAAFGSGTPAPSVASQLPLLPGSVASAPKSNLPSLNSAFGGVPPAVAPTTSTGLPVLGALNPASSGSPSSIASSMPALPGFAPTTGQSLPALPPLPTGAPVASLPSLPPGPGTGAMSSLPVLSGPSQASAAAASLPPLPGSSTSEGIPGLPPLAPSTASTVSVMPSLPGATPAPEGAPLVAPTPAVASLGAPAPGEQTTTLFSPPDAGITNLSSTPDRPVTRQGSSNYSGDQMAAPMVPVAPSFTPPALMTPITAASAPVLEPQGGLTGYYKQDTMTADLAERESAFGTPIPSNAMRRYTFTGRSASNTPSPALAPMGVAPMEVIVLNTGKEFAGRVVQRGLTWRIELPNGSLITIPGGRVVTTRAPMSPAPTPQAL
jgi:uncharacterized lipoprotein YddW (UPF0748 family)